jgi:hypothetical protein
MEFPSLPDKRDAGSPWCVYSRAPHEGISVRQCKARKPEEVAEASRVEKSGVVPVIDKYGPVKRLAGHVTHHANDRRIHVVRVGNQEHPRASKRPEVTRHIPPGCVHKADYDIRTLLGGKACGDRGQIVSPDGCFQRKRSAIRTILVGPIRAANYLLVTEARRKHVTGWAAGGEEDSHEFAPGL